MKNIRVIVYPQVTSEFRRNEYIEKAKNEYENGNMKRIEIFSEDKNTVIIIYNR